ncbi:MAG: hypothetical protein FJ241_09820 [Nitrospira sp.]|nr:hypothetical protein [Nitrospira sp.]
MTTSENILFLVLGWLLGLFSPIIYDEVKKRQHRKEIRVGILTELKELRYKLMGVVYLVSIRNGTYDRELLNWIKPIVEEYNGTHQKDNIYKSIKNHLTLTDEELSAISEKLKTESLRGLSVKKYELPFLDSKINYLTFFDESFQNKILEMRSQLSLLHEEVNQAHFYFEKTFDSSMSTENHRIIRENLEDSYKNIAKKARTIADRIGKVMNK